MRPSLSRPNQVVLLAIALVALFVRPCRAADPVTEWSLTADQLGRGTANWHSMAIMHIAMHDSLNAALPHFARWFPPEPDEPPSSGALPQAAMVAAARQVLLALHPDGRAEIERTYERALARLSQGSPLQAGIVLGGAIGVSVLRARADDGYTVTRPFPVGKAPGAWRPTPPDFARSGRTATRPFLFGSDLPPGSPGPPALGSPAYVRAVEEVRLLGAEHDAARSPAETAAAYFWAYQLSQRGFIHLAATLLDRAPRSGGLHDHARLMAQLATALADGTIIAWAEKERFSFWRPVTAIRSGGFGVAANPDWLPLILTPAHPDYPSGHATDCQIGARFLSPVFGAGPVAYPAIGGPKPVERHFPDLAAAAEECAMSRVWAGVHFRFASDEGRRIAEMVVPRALAAVPPLR